MQQIQPESDPSSERSASRTALGAARLRAVHLLLDDAPPIFEDPLALRLLEPGAAQEVQEHSDRFRTLASRVIRCDVLARSRYAEDQLAAAVRRGVRQYVILGAGLDTFAYRQPDWASGLRIIEVDHAASQLDKQARLNRAGIESPSNLSYAAADLETDILARVLETAGLDPSRPTFVACLGVLIYLSEGAADGIFAMAAGLTAGSEFVFEFSRPDDSPADLPSPGSAGAHVASVGEPWRTRFQPDTILSRLTAVGFTSISFLFAEDVTQRYLGGRNDDLRAPSRVVLADAMV